MKNPYRIALPILTCFFLVGTFGLFLIRNQTREPVLVQTVSTASPNSNSTHAASSPLVNINTAPLETLIQLPEIGPVLAQRIIDYRETNGLFESVGDLADVPGIGEKRLELIWDLVTVKP